MKIKKKETEYLKNKYPLKKLLANPYTSSPTLCWLLIAADKISTDLGEIKELLKEDKTVEKN